MVQLADDIVERLIDCVENHIGLRIRNSDRDSFRKSLLSRMNSANIELPEEYLHLLETGTSESRREWKALVILLTTGESYFFRDKGHFFLLQNTILPELLKHKPKQRSLRVWSAGCSTGEEPYSIAILLDMLLPDLVDWNLLILGTDINEDSLEKAEFGRYTPWSFRLMEKDIREKYFTARKDEWQISDKIKRMVTFKSGNLLAADFYSQNPEICDMDLIICRNVFIYFKKEAVAVVFGKFSKILKDGGYLITGHGELQGHELTNLCQKLYPEAVIYKKAPALPRPVPEQKNSHEQGEGKNQGPVKVEPIGRTTVHSRLVRKSPDVESLPKLEKVRRTGWGGEAIPGKGNSISLSDNKCDTLCSKATVYANSGEYAKAEEACREALRINAGLAQPYFLLAQIAEAKGNDQEAKELFRKAIYLDSAYVAAYCELAGLYEKDNDPGHARKARVTAMELLKSLPAQAPVKPYDTTAGELLKCVEYLIGPGGAGGIPQGAAEKNRR